MEEPSRELGRSGGPPGGWLRSKGPAGCLGGVRRPYWRAGKGRETLPEGQQWIEGPAGWSGLVGRPSWRASRGCEALQEGS